MLHNWIPTRYFEVIFDLHLNSITSFNLKLFDHVRPQNVVDFDTAELFAWRKNCHMQSLQCKHIVESAFNLYYLRLYN